MQEARLAARVEEMEGELRRMQERQEAAAQAERTLSRHIEQAQEEAARCAHPFVPASRDRWEARGLHAGRPCCAVGLSCDPWSGTRTE